MLTLGVDTILESADPWHQGSITTFKIMCRDAQGFWNGVHWDGKIASIFVLQETDEQKAGKKLFERGSR